MEPKEDVISRQPPPKEVQEVCDFFAVSVEECVNLGSHVLDWCAQKPSGGYGDATILLLYRHVLEMLDGVSVLVRSHCAEPAKPLLRSAFEGYLGLSYILEADTEKRCLAFQVAHVYKRLALYAQFDDSTSEGKRLASMGDPVIANMQESADKATLASRIANLESMLGKPEFAPVDEEWKRTKKKPGRKSTPEWFSLFDGPKNIADLATKFGLASWYITLYREWSGTVHGTGVFRHITTGPSGHTTFWAIRYPGDLQRVTLLAGRIGRSATELMVNSLVSERLIQFFSLYDKNLRKRMQRLEGPPLLVLNEDDRDPDEGEKP